MEITNNIQTEVNSFIKLCPICNCMNKFNTRINNKNIRITAGKKCIKCCSVLNNKKLKEKEYYKTYYENNAETYKARDKLRYDKIRKKNLVEFTISAENVVET